MAQTFLREQARVRQRLGKSLCVTTQESRTLTARHHECRHGGRLPVLGRQWLPRCVAFQKPGVVWKRMGNRLELCPCPWHEVHQRNNEARSAHPCGHEVLDRLISPIRGDQIGEVFGETLRRLTISGIDEQRRFLQRQFVDSQATCRRFEGKDGSRGQAPDEGLAGRS